MKPFIRHLGALAVAAALIASAVAAVADADPATREAEYRRLHDSAVAFAETADKTADRYDLHALDMDQVRRLIAQSEQAARAQQFDVASAQARQAYEMLRQAITGAVAAQGKRAGGN